MDDCAIENLPPAVKVGVYCGFAQVNGGPVYKMVMSLGYNPCFGNMKKSLVSSLCHRFQVLLASVNLLILKQTIFVVVRTFVLYKSWTSCGSSILF